MGIAETLTVIFVVLKLTGVVAWSWFWILSPMIFVYVFPVVFVLVWLCIIAFYVSVFTIFGVMFSKK